MPNFKFSTRHCEVEAVTASVLTSTSNDTTAYPSWFMPAIINGTIKVGDRIEVNGKEIDPASTVLVKHPDGRIEVMTITAFNAMYEVVTVAPDTAA